MQQKIVEPSRRASRSSVSKAGIQHISVWSRALRRDYKTATYVVVIVLLGLIPLSTAGFLVVRQSGDVRMVERKSIGIDFDVRLRAVTARLDELRQNTLLGRKNMSGRLAVERALTRLYDYGSGRGRVLGVEKSLERIQNAWVAVPDTGDQIPQIDKTIAKVSDLGARIDELSSMRSGTDEATTALIDAFAFALPTIAEHLTEQRILIARSNGRALERDRVGFEMLSRQSTHAYEAAQFDVERASALRSSSPRSVAALSDVGAALIAYNGAVSRAPAGAPMSLDTNGDRLSKALESASTAIAADAQRALGQRLADESRRLNWVLFDALAAALFEIIVGFLLWRSLRRRDRRALSHARDENERIEAEHENDRMRELLALTEARFEAVFDRASIGVAILDTSGALVRTNAALERFLPGATPADVGAAHADFPRVIAGTLDGYTVELESKRGDAVSWVEAIVSLVRDDAGEPLFAVSMLKDVTERRRLDDLLRFEAKHDGLVQLPNRSYLVERMRETMLDNVDSSSVPGVMFVDLDGFKVVNDSLGHETGDRVLVAAARRLVAAVDACDFVARFGGDEFVTLLRGGATREDTIAAAERVVRALAVPFEVDGREIFVTISAGLALVDRPYDSVEELLRDADTAMYSAKTSGRSRCAVFDAEMRDSATRRLELGSQLRRALEREQIFLVYQPVVKLATERIVSFEVLVRWEHPELGLVAPGEFIPLAEELGLIVPIGRWILERACAQLTRWRAESHAFESIYLAVNASVRELLQTDYCEFVERTLERHGLRRGDLVLEVTETAVLQSDRYAEGTLQRLKRAGVGLAIDDFGTGYSSLRYLQYFPFDHLKIDASFVKGANGELASEAIVTMLVALGRSFGVNVVAEGVETAEQAAMLRSLGCSAVQGYFFGLPVASSLVRDVLERRTPLAS